MKLFENILNKILLTESVSVKDVESAIDNHNRIIINYHSKGEDNNTGARVIEVYAYGLTKAGNPCIRAFQPVGDTTSRVPSWKFFRLDRITAWQPTKQTFTHPADFYYQNIGDFNENGDETMSVVYKIAQFTDKENDVKTPEAQPKSKEDIYKTDTEKKMERFRQQMENPITLSDIKTNDAFKKLPQKKETGPKSKEDIYKTDTEKKMERFRQQMENPRKIDLSQFSSKPRPKSEEETKKDLEKLRNTLNNKTMSLSDLNKKMSDENPSEDIYKTDTEKKMERFRQQMENPRKIDLGNIPKR